MNRKIIKNNKKLSDSTKLLFKQAGAEVLFFNRPFFVFDYIIHVSLFRLVDHIYFIVFPDFETWAYLDSPLEKDKCIFLDLNDEICGFTYALIVNQKVILGSSVFSQTEEELLEAFKLDRMKYFKEFSL